MPSPGTAMSACPHPAAAFTGGAGTLAGKVALVTGGARSVGAVITRRLAAAGATVVVNHFHRSPAEARELCAEIERAGGTAVALRASVAREEQLDRMFAKIGELFGRLDILVNNAADGAFAGLDDVRPDQLDRAWQTNAKGSLGCALRARPLMKLAGGGSIVNVSTLGGAQFVMHGYLACGPAKAAVESLTRYLAVGFAADGIRVNTAAAGMLQSRAADQFPDAAAMQSAIKAATPMGRLGTPEEFAEVVAFLAGPQSNWITGQLILADGGLACGHALLAPAPEPAAAPVVPERTAEPVPEAAAAVVSAHSSDEAEVAPMDESLDPVEDEVVVVGMAIAVSGASDPEQFWHQLLNGDNRFTPVPPDRWDNDSFHSADRQAVDKTYSRHSAFITDFETSPQLLASLPDGPEPESTTLWLRHALTQGLAGVGRRDSDRAAFLVGYTADGSQHLEEACVSAGVLSRAGDILAGLASAGTTAADATEQARRRALVEQLVARRYHRRGPDELRFLPNQVGLAAMSGILPPDTDLIMVDTACSSSLYAIDIGIKGLHEGRYDLAVCGGAFALGPRGSILFAKLNGLSARGEVRSLDKDSDGVLFADSAAVVVLKKLSRARADGDQILGSLRTFGSSSDGKGKAIYAPSAAGQKLAIMRARERDAGVGVPPWVVAHATGTPAGDVAEFITLRETCAGPDEVLISSNKSVVGHTGWAAGAVSVIQVLLALRHDLIPAQHRFVEAPADFHLAATNVRVATSAVPWRRTPGKRRVAAVSGLGSAVPTPTWSSRRRLHRPHPSCRRPEPPPRRSGSRSSPAPHTSPTATLWGSAMSTRCRRSSRSSCRQA